MKPAAPLFVGPRHTGRTIALQVLIEARAHEAFVRELLDDAFTAAESVLSSSDRRLATQLVYGVIRRRGTLDHLIRPFLSRKPHEVEPWLWDALRLGVFQLTLLTQIPPHAAINETVELAVKYGRPGAKGFINAVLRKVAGLVTDGRSDAPATDALPLEAGQYRKLSQPALPDPATNRVEYLAAAFSLPVWLSERWLARSSWEECVRLGSWFAGQAPLWLRCNRLRTDRASFLAALQQANIAATPADHEAGVLLTDSASIRDLPGYEQGWFTVQDQSAMRVGSALAPKPGNRVLDMCAAPGGKTTHLAELMNNTGEIVACDIDEGRLQTVRDLSRRLGIDIVKTHRLDGAKNEAPPPGPFDAVLVDVPCSNTGVLGRRPEVRWRLQPGDFAQMVPLQTKLLIQAAERICPGGTIVYSTCSMEPEENRQVVDNALRRVPDLVFDAEEKPVPGQPADGGYWARLKRKG